MEWQRLGSLAALDQFFLIDQLICLLLLIITIRYWIKIHKDFF
jgi:hypothetical protein